MDFTYNDLARAFKNIFDIDNLYISNETIKRIEPESIKIAFRKKAKLCHPDMANLTGINENTLNEKFKLINESYKFLLSIINENEKIFDVINKENLKSKFQNTSANFNQKNQNKKTYPPPKKNGDFSCGDKYKRYKTGTFYYSGAIPQRKLRFSEFLFYSGKIDWHTMITSIVRQFQVRPRFGEIGAEFNFFGIDDICYILKNTRIGEKFGEAAIRLNLIDLYKSNVILGKQKNYNYPIGKFFIENGILNEHKLSLALEDLKKHNFTFF
ncbi:MAG TPA: DnaJ domain-containing protein [Spirochaetota bacterium]|nr:DnaJ domain-containing protein [Spirochaetota bacterium]